MEKNDHDAMAPSTSRHPEDSPVVVGPDLPHGGSTGTSRMLSPVKTPQFEKETPKKWDQKPTPSKDKEPTPPGMKATSSSSGKEMQKHVESTDYKSGQEPAKPMKTQRRSIQHQASHPHPPHGQPNGKAPQTELFQASTTPSKKSRTGSLVKPRDTALQATRRETPVICEATNINFVEQSQHHPVEKERAAEPGVSSPQSPQKEPKTAEVRALLSFCLFFCFTVNVYP